MRQTASAADDAHEADTLPGSLHATEIAFARVGPPLAPCPDVDPLTALPCFAGRTAYEHDRDKIIVISDRV